MSDDPAEFVAQCARAIGTKEQCWYRPARITAVTVQRRGEHDLTVWIVTEVVHDPTKFAPIHVSYRFFLHRLPQQVQPIISTDAIVRLMAGQVHPCGYWDVPGNVRDLAATVTLRAFGVLDFEIFK